MLKVTYAETGLCLEYCPEPLDLLLSDRVCMYVHAQRSITLQPMQASIPLPTSLMGTRELERFSEVEVSVCDCDWLEVTLRGLWITEDSDQDEGVFVTELNPRLEQRLLRLWMLSQTTLQAVAIAHDSLR